MRTVLIASTLLTGLTLGIVLTVFHLFENETSVAGTDPMVIADIDVFQDTIPVLKGSSIQLVLGIRIHTKGKAQQLNFSGMELSTRGTSKPTGTYVCNARLWFTGKNSVFIPGRQMGSTVEKIDDENIQLEGKQQLYEGDNYFWVTYDVNQVAGSISTQIDAECISVQVGTLRYEPMVSAPRGAHRILNNIPYYSMSNGDISSLDTWNTRKDGSGKRPSNFNQSNATFHIQSGHILRNDLNACITYLIIERNGVLISASGIKSEQLEIRGGGTLVQEKEIIDHSSLQKFTIRNGGNYIHNNEGPLPGKTKEFDAFSNVVLNNYGIATFTEPIIWGNLSIDGKVNTNIDFANCFKNIKGDLELRSTGGTHCLYTTTDDTINVGGDLIINGGRMILLPGNKMVLNVNKDFVLKSGCLSDAIGGKTSKGSVEFNPGTKCYLQSGELRLTGKHSAINFHQEFTVWLQDTALMTLPDITVMPGCTLRLAGKSTGNIQENRTLTVSSTAMLDCGSAVIKGKGSFRLEKFATLATGHAEGIHTETIAGSIQTRSRFYSSSGDYIFTGKSNPQGTGVFTTYPVSNTVNQMTINKSNASAILILQQDLSITGRLVKERGSINKNSHKLEMGEIVTATLAPGIDR